MNDPYRRERIEGWVGDYCDSPAFRAQASRAREYAPEVLAAFLAGASAHRDLDPSEVEEPDLKAALLEQVARLDLPRSVHGDVPALCASFLEDLERQGRLGAGRSLGLFVKALREPYLERASGKPKPIVAAGPPIGRNDPCPCGSGMKYKRCCLGRLGG